MSLSSPCDQIATALLAAQGKLQDPDKTRDVNAGSRRYSYAELDKSLPAIRRILNAEGLFLGGDSEVDGEGTAWVVTEIVHTSGQWYRSKCRIVIGKQGDPQAEGSGITYARRYGLFLALGLVAGGDDDGEAARPDHKTQTEGRPAIAKASTAQQVKTETKAQTKAAVPASAGPAPAAIDALVAVRRDGDSDSPRTEWWVRVVGGRVLLDCPQLTEAIASPVRRAA